jgi:allantoinase
MEARILIEAIRAEGLPVTFETCPHYLFFSTEDVSDGDTRMKCAPPIREWPQCEYLRQMVFDRWIATIGSDHSPAPPALKELERGDFRRAWGGISSLQLLLPATYSALYIPDPLESALEPQESGIQTIIQAISLSPAVLVGLAGRKGAIGAGYDADLFVFDPDAKLIVKSELLQHRHKVTPYLDQVLHGVVETTYLRGRKVYDHGQFLGGPSGQLLQRPRGSSS